MFGVSENTRRNFLKKQFWRNMTENIPIIMKIINLPVQGAKWTLSTKNMKKTIPSHIIIKLLKSIEKENKIPQCSQREKTQYIQKTKRLCHISHQKQWKWEDSEATFLKDWRKKKVKVEFYAPFPPPQKNSLKNEGEWQHLQTYRCWKTSSRANP